MNTDLFIPRRWQANCWAIEGVFLWMEYGHSSHDSMRKLEFPYDRQWQVRRIQGSFSSSWNVLARREHLDANP